MSINQLIIRFVEELRAHGRAEKGQILFQQLDPQCASSSQRELEGRNVTKQKNMWAAVFKLEDNSWFKFLTLSNTPLLMAAGDALASTVTYISILLDSYSASSFTHARGVTKAKVSSQHAAPKNMPHVQM